MTEFVIILCAAILGIYIFVLFVIADKASLEQNKKIRDQIIDEIRRLKP